MAQRPTGAVLLFRPLAVYKNHYTKMRSDLIFISACSYNLMGFKGILLHRNHPNPSLTKEGSKGQECLPPYLGEDRCDSMEEPRMN